MNSKVMHEELKPLNYLNLALLWSVSSENVLNAVPVNPFLPISSISQNLFE
jgi:hypothetical protein